MIRESSKKELISNCEFPPSSDDDSLEGDRSEVEEPIDTKKIAKEKKFKEQYDRVMEGSNKKL